MKKITNWMEIEEGLKQGYYGSVTLHETVGLAGLRLYETNIADPDADDCGWECAEWYLVNDDGDETIIARCDGYTGIEKLIRDDTLRDILGRTEEQWEDDFEETSRVAFWGKIHPYEITGELIAAAKYATLEEAADDYAGEVAIWTTPQYYEGTCNAPTADYVREGDGCAYNDIMTFACAADAQEYIDDTLIGDEPYCLAHGEAARPDYKIVKHA